MKHAKIIGLLAVAAAALMAFAGTAMATTVTTTTGGAAATPTIHAVNSGGLIKLANPIANIECASTLEGTVSNHGAGVTAGGKLGRFEVTSCTNNWHVTITVLGLLEVHYTSGHNGSVTSTGTKVDATRLGVTCVYTTNNTSIGTLTGGNPAVLTIEGGIPIVPGESSALCGSGNGKWEGKYETTSALYVAS
jgi:hypothetical protein